MRAHTMSTGAFNMIGGPPPPLSSSRLPGSAAYQNTCPPPPQSSNNNRVPPSNAAYQNTCPPPPSSSNYNRISNANPKNENLSHDHPKDFTPSRTLITPPAPPPPPPKKSSRVDANEIPRPLKPQKDIIYTTRSGATRKVPPHSGSFFKAIDKGNCSPRLMRVTACAVPTTKDVLGNTGIPLALVVTPFAGPENGEEPLHLVDMGESPPR